ncbi:MAG: RNA-binding transcriptional accessory protein [Bacteroidales bacterium]|nr:RNA-binding transcriptional accessory protein [Bacteroidales bacterium]
MQEYIKYVSEKLMLNATDVENTIKLIEDGCTVAFMARYRKELTGGLDEVIINSIVNTLKKAKTFFARKEVILSSIESQGLLTEELKEKIEAIDDITELEDFYLPYKPKRRTRATIAKEKGLESLAWAIIGERNISLANFIDNELQGARDIVAEWVSENPISRQKMRNYFKRNAVIKTSKAKGYKENSKYEELLGINQLAYTAPSHRILALFRAEAEGELKVSFSPQEDYYAIEYLIKGFIKRDNSTSQQKLYACEDAYKRLLAPSIENEFRALLKEKADEKAIYVFSKNLRQLLMAAPLGEKRVLAIDPGVRTGCKVACLNANGRLLCHDVIFPQTNATESIRILTYFVKTYDIEAIAIGNGTFSKETEEFVRSIDFGKEIIISIVNENGASVYSASEVAREELGDYDITVRGAVSIGRRLQDPLAELVKIEPKSIGVGQYQHDVNQNLLHESLHQTVESCVNQVGVELNTASTQLLSYVSGIGPSLAKNIVDYRNEHGAFSSRKELLKVKRFGEKAFEQSAGFLRIRQGENPLDNTAVHPERYGVVEQMAKDAGCSVKELINDSSKRVDLNLYKYVEGNCGLHTLIDIFNELEKPSRDIRTKFEEVSLNKGINKLEQIQNEQILEGIITNITAFGAFVDLGVHVSGLIHRSEIADEFFGEVSDVLSINQRVVVRVISLDYERKRIGLSLKLNQD